MMKVKATSRGQVVIPKPVRTALKIKAGSELEVESSADSVTFRLPSRAKRRSIDDLIGCLPYIGPPKSLHEMQAGVDAALEERWGRPRG